MLARGILGSGRTGSVSSRPFLNSSGWWCLISSVFLIRISCHKITHANGYYGAWPGWAVSISVLPLTKGESENRSGIWQVDPSAPDQSHPRVFLRAPARHLRGVLGRGNRHWTCVSSFQKKGKNKDSGLMNSKSVPGSLGNAA